MIVNKLNWIFLRYLAIECVRRATTLHCHITKCIEWPEYDINLVVDKMSRKFSIRFSALLCSINLMVNGTDCTIYTIVAAFDCQCSCTGISGIRKSEFFFEIKLMVFRMQNLQNQIGILQISKTISRWSDYMYTIIINKCPIYIGRSFVDRITHFAYIY